MLTISSIRNDYNLIAYWYIQSVLCGRADKVFYAAPHDIKYLIDWFDQLEVCLGAFQDGKLIGVGFVSNTLNFRGEGLTKRGEVGFGFLNNCNVLSALHAGRLMIDYILGELGYDILLGTTPELNKVALAFAKRLKFEQYGPVPYTSFYLGQITGTYTSIITKEKWTTKK